MILSIDLDRINIDSKFQGKGIGRIFFEKIISRLINLDAKIYIVDQTDYGIGLKLYGGQKTTDLFDVNVRLRGKRQNYLVEKQKGEKKGHRLNYVRVDLEKDPYILYVALEAATGIESLSEYFMQHKDQIPLLKEVMKKIPSLEDQEKDQKEAFQKLKILLH